MRYEHALKFCQKSIVDVFEVLELKQKKFKKLASSGISHLHIDHFTPLSHGHFLSLWIMRHSLNTKLTPSQIDIPHCA